MPPAPAPADAPTAQDRKLVAVLDVKSGAGTEALASALTTMLTAEVGASDGLRAVSRNELRALIAHQADAQLVGCDDVKCFSDVAKLASADLLVAGQVDRIDGAHVLALTLVDPTVPAIVARQEAVWRGSTEEMLALVRPLVARLVDAPHAARHLGSLEVTTTAGAHVIVDGKDVGAAPLAQPIAQLQSGVHTISLQKPDHYTWTNDVVVARDETTMVRTQLVEVPLLAQPWFWAATGGVVVVAAGATAGIVIANQLNQDAPPKVVIGQ